ncbi:hypothetical protein ACHAW5_001410, partial [Stephanodiscus triporus]
EGCGASVTCKGGSREAVRNNPIISAVASSLREIERIVATAPEDWWTRREDDEGRNDCSGASADGETLEVVDFRIAANGDDGDGDDEDNDNDEGGREGELSDGDHDDDDASVAANEFRDGGLGREEAASSSSPPLSNERAVFVRENSDPLPEFSPSPIAVRDSQNLSEPNDYHDDHNEGRTETSGQLGRIVVPISRKIDAKYADGSSSPGGGSLPSSGGRPHRAAAARVSFRRHPKAFLLDPSWKLSVEHARRLRRCVDDGLVSVLGIRPHDDDDEFGDDATKGSFDRSGFDFDAEGVGESFLSMLSSNRTDNVPPAPASFYAIGVERDPNFTVDGSVIVPRSFPYYLAVACGLPIVDAEFISSLGNSRGCGPTNGQCYPFPSQLVADGTISEEKRGGGDHLVLGASNYTWGAPTRAREKSVRPPKSFIEKH